MEDSTNTKITKNPDVSTVITHTDAEVPLPSQKPTKRNKFISMLKKHKRVLFAFIGLFIFAIVAYYVLYQPSDSKSPTQVVGDYQNQLCDLSGQSTFSDFNSGEETYSPYYDGEKIENDVIARLLNKNPVVFELIDEESSRPIFATGLLASETVSKSDADSFDSLNFNDIFSAERYGYTVAGFELGYATDLTNIQKVGTNVKYFDHGDEFDDLINRSGLLVRYKKEGDNNELDIFNDGRLYYNDSTGTTLVGKQLSQEQMRELFELFAASNYDNLENTYNFYWPSVSLICNRFQNIAVSGNEIELQPIIDYLDMLVASYEEETGINIYYDSKEKIEMREWPYEVSIPEIKILHDEALSYFRQTGEVQTDNLVYKNTPFEFRDSLPKGTSFTNIRVPKVYYKENGRVFYVAQGTNKCIGDPCKVNTLYTLYVEEIYFVETNFAAVNLWPTNTGIDLAKSDSQSVSRDVYQKNKTLLDSIGSYGVNNNFIDDNYLYSSVRISKN